jgi:ligand-binding sensor domain-containing protein
MKIKLIIFLLTTYSAVTSGQNPNWIIYNTSNSGLPDNIVPSISIDQFNNKWIGTVYGGVAKFDNSNWTIYNPSNSGLNVQNVQVAFVDPNDNKWFGTDWNGKISRFDNNNWTVYDSASTNSVLNDHGRVNDFLFDNGKLYAATGSDGLMIFDGNSWIDSSIYNSSIPGNYIYDLEKDNNGNVWIAHWNNGLTKFDGTTWVNYNTSNSILPSNDITSVAIESSGIIWATSRYDGLVKIDGSNWTLFTTSNSGLPSNSFNTIKIDGSDTKWIATGNGTSGFGDGLVKYDGVTWTVYNTTNSNIPSNDVISILVDSYDNIWIGTAYDGLAVFKEGGVILLSNDIANTQPATKIFPNPFSNQLTFFLADNELTMISIYDFLGQQILQQSFKNSITINTEQLAQGIYFYELRNSKGTLKTGKVVKQ